jgi:hypothetical protein
MSAAGRFIASCKQEQPVSVAELELQGADANCPLWVDAVEKLSDEQRAGNNRIQVPRSLNQCCALDSYLESMLLIRPSKIVFRQHRSLADIDRF